MSDRINVEFLNNEGQGFAETVSVAPGTTAIQFFQLKMGSGADPARYLIRVNKTPVQAAYVLANNDKFSVTPTKIEGA